MLMMGIRDFEQFRKKQLTGKKQVCSVGEGRVLDFTDNRISFKSKSPSLYEITKNNEGLEIVIFDGLINPKVIYIENDQLKSIDLYGGELLEQKKKSVLGRALIGGVLLGGIGAVIGGISGTGSKDTYDELVLEITYGNTEENIIFFEIPKSKHKILQPFLRKNFFRYMK